MKPTAGFTLNVASSIAYTFPAARYPWKEGPLKLLGVFNDGAITVVVYLAAPGKEGPSLTEEATEVKYFAPDDVQWHDLAFPTTTDALTAWVASTRGEKST